jgi:pyridoxine 4-dehydrogenase
MTKQTQLGGTFDFPVSTLSIQRIGYGAMQLAGKDGDKLV